MVRQALDTYFKGRIMNRQLFHGPVIGAAVQSGILCGLIHTEPTLFCCFDVVVLTLSVELDN